MSDSRGKRALPLRVGQAFVELLSSTRYRVLGDSMYPALADGDCLLVAPFKASQGPPGRGDIVVFQHPILPGRVYIKRIVGLPDEHLRFEGSRVYVNDRPLEERYLGGHRSPSGQTSLEWWLGPDACFVLSDNRDRGQDDSRAFGPVARRLIVGRAWFRYWPLCSWGAIPRQPN